MTGKSTGKRAAAPATRRQGAPRVDRRVQRTKRLLSRALVELIVEKGSYELVTVQDILDRADVGRSTFYAHYENKDVLLVDGPRNMGLTLFGEVPSAADNGHHPMAFRALLEHVHESGALAKAMLRGGSGTLILSAFRAQLAEAIRRHYQKRQHGWSRGRRAFTYLTDAAAAAVISLISSWIDDDYQMSVDAVSAECQGLVEGILRAG